MPLDLLRRARIRALRQGTSVNALVRDDLENYAGIDPAKDAIRDFLQLTEQSRASNGPGRRTWTREDVYDRR